MKSNLKRNHTLDVIKLLASFLVVFIHVPFYGVAGEIIKNFSRVAVPVFFMTSGYFVYNNDSKTIIRKIKKIAGILIFTSCLYNFTNILADFITDGITGVADYFLRFTEFESWLNLLLFNLPFSATRLWFLFSLIHVYILQLLFNKFGFAFNTLFIFSVCGIIIHLLIGSVLPYFGIDVPDYFCRNNLLFGYPFFGLGLIFKHRENVVVRTNLRILTVCTLLGCGLSLVPLLYNPVSQFSIGTLFLIFAIFTFALKESNVTYPRWVLNLCKCSLGIYIFHRPVTTAVKLCLSILNISNVCLYENLLPILVCIGTAIFTLLLQTLNNKIKGRKKLKKAE